MSKLRSSIRRSAFIALLLATSSSVASAQTLESEKYKLDNGLTVILHVDKTLPQATINLWYRVGAKNEPAGRSGFAHLFEHLMFMGTKRAPGGDFDTIMEAGGGNNNATTSLDRTNYFSQGPSELLPTLLWLDADRLEAIGANMTQDKLDRQRDIVRNEIRQNVENTPYGRAYEEMFRHLYPAGHPYHNSVYGTHADLESATLNDVRDFFATFYNPANCSLVVAGDFDLQTIKPLIEKLYGTLPAGSAPQDRKVEPAKLDRVVRSTLLDKVELPKVLMVYHAPGEYQPGDADAQLAAQILGDGQSSRLYQRLVLNDETCVEANAYIYPGQLQSLLMIDVSAKPGADLVAIEKAIDEELARFSQEGPTADELDRRKVSIEMIAVNALQSLYARADKLNEYEYYFGDPNSLQRDLDRYRNASPDSVRDSASRIITPDARLITTVLPETSANTASPRDEKPTIAEASPFTPPTPETFTLESGVKVVLFHKPELPLVATLLLAKPTTLTLDEPAVAGRSDLLRQMLEEGTGDFDGPGFAAALQALGADFGARADRTSLSTSLVVLDRNFAEASKLWLDATFRPRLLDADFTRVKALHLADLEQQAQIPSIVAARVGQAILYGETSYGTPTQGTTLTIESLDLAAVKSLHETLLSEPKSLTLYVAGNVTRDQVQSTLGALLPTFETKQEDRAAIQPPTPTTSEALRVVIVDRPDAPQTAVRVLAPGISYSDPLRVRLELMNTVLGGSFTSRLNANLREDKGYTYGSGSRFTTDPHTGWFSASADVKSDVTGPAVKEMLNELKKIATGDISNDELNKAQKSYQANLVEQFGTLGGMNAAAAGLEKVGVGYENLATDLEAVRAASAEALNSVAQQYPKLDQAILILVGDEKLIREQIKDLGLPEAVSYDVNGKPRP